MKANPPARGAHRAATADDPGAITPRARKRRLAKRAFDAMMTMNKNDIAAIEKARRG